MRRRRAGARARAAGEAESGKAKPAGMTRFNRYFSSLADGRRGILWMLFSMLLFANVNAITKLLTETYPITEVIWARFFFHMALLVVVFRGRLLTLLASRARALQILRSFFMLVTTILIFLAVHLMPLVETSAMLATAPILVTAWSWPLLGESVDRRRWIAVIAGITGALIIIRPGSAAMQLVVLVPLAAACVLSLYQTTTRLVSRRDIAVTTFVYTPLVGFVASSAAVPFVWTPPVGFDWLLMAALGLFGGGAHFALIKAFEAAPAATVAPFNYSGIVWAAVYGVFLFGDWPDAWTFAGALIIIGSGLYVFRLEHRRRA